MDTKQYLSPEDRARKEHVDQLLMLHTMDKPSRIDGIVQQVMDEILKQDLNYAEEEAPKLGYRPVRSKAHPRTGIPFELFIGGKDACNPVKS